MTDVMQQQMRAKEHPMGMNPGMMQPDSMFGAPGDKGLTDV